MIIQESMKNRLFDYFLKSEKLSVHDYWLVKIKHNDFSTHVTQP